MAALPGSETGPGLTRFVELVVEEEQALEDTSLTAMLTADPQTMLSSSADGWLDGNGRRHHAVPISAGLADEVLVVGVAVLCSRAAPGLTPGVSACAAALGEFLLRAGDVTSTTAATLVESR